MYQLLLLLITTPFITAYPREELSEINNLQLDQRPLYYFLEQPLGDQLYAQQTQKDEIVKAPLQQEQQPQLQEQQPQLLQQQQVYQPGGFQYVDPQLQYPGYNQQTFPRIQPSILLYGAGGQGQPILINPGSPPGNFLVPQQPGVIYRNNPQNPVFVGGYPNPKPAHIPPIEKDAEEIPTNPASIPPFPTKPTENKPEKLETFNEDQFPKSNGESDLEEPDKTAPPRQPLPANRQNLKPGQRFFILNGEPLYQNYPLNYPEVPNFGFQPVDQSFQQLQDGQKQQEFGYNIPVQTILLRNADDLNQQKIAPNSAQPSGQHFAQNFVPLTQPNIPQEAVFRSNLPINVLNDNAGLPLAQFRFTPPTNAYFPIQDDVDDDAVVINANFGDVNGGEARPAQQGPPVPALKVPEPGTAQASPGAVALAGPGGTAGAAPRATALAGKGGLAVSSPKATAIAGAKKEEKEEKGNKEKQEKKPTRKTKE